MPPDSDRHKSSLGIKYPGRRDVSHKSAYTFLEDKREDDGAEGLWRIHDDLYDMTDFIKHHPGGQDWLRLTKGTDVTEAFEVHHISTKAELLLPKFHIRKAKTKRKYPFTFKEDGFYRTLKKNVREVLKTAPRHSLKTSDIYTDGALLTTLLLAVFSCYFKSYILAIFSGVFLAFTTIAAHNYFHRKDNYRMYYFDISFMSSREWRVTHALSHHLYTNSIDDIEISMFEPTFEYMPKKKGPKKYLTWLWAPLAYVTFLHMGVLKKWIVRFTKGLEFQKTELLPLVVPISMFVLGGQSLLYTLWMWQVIIISCGSYFLFIGTNAAHHHPEIFHDGDTPRKGNGQDWGLHQLDTVMDRVEVNGNHWLVLTSFGEHALHHLFPTLDHGILTELYPVFEKTAKQFGVYLRMTTQLELIKGQFAQLVRETPNPNPPAY